LHYIPITNSKLYKQVFDVEEKYATRFFVAVYSKLNPQLASEVKFSKQYIGLIASKKVGNAVKRNFCKRRIRAALHELEYESNNPFHAIIIARKNLISCDYQDFKKELLKFLKRCCG
jgi:ribonuclease P protein component